MLLGVVMFLFGVFSSGGASGLFNMFDFPSIIITLGGSISGTLASNKLQDFIAGLKSITLTFKEVPQDPAAVIRNIIDLSNTARKEGLLALEEAANGIEDEFLKKGIMLVVDGTDPELVRGIMETDLGCIEQRHKKSIAVWEKWGELGPAWGMIGTPDRIDPDAEGHGMMHPRFGPAMAVGAGYNTVRFVDLPTGCVTRRQASLNL